MKCFGRDPIVVYVASNGILCRGMGTIVQIELDREDLRRNDGAETTALLDRQVCTRTQGVSAGATRHSSAVSPSRVEAVTPV